MTPSQQTLRDVFLSRFDSRIREQVVEFGKGLQDLNADYVFTMARKATCLVDCLQRLNLTTIPAVVTSERVLDMPTHWLRGKRVALVDDALISGTTLARAAEQLDAAGAIITATKVLCVNTDWWTPELVKPDPPFERLDDASSSAFCASLVRALSLFPRPYAVDYPIFGNLRVPANDLQSIGRVPGWSTYDITDAIQRAHGVLALVAEPSATVRHDLDSGIAWPVSKHTSLIKIRLYGRILPHANAHRSVAFFRAMPIVAFDPLDVDSVRRLWQSLLASDQLSATRLDGAFGTSPVARLRFLQYAIGFRLAALWFRHLKQGLPVALQLNHEMGSMLAAFPPPIADELLHLCETEGPLLRGAPRGLALRTPRQDEAPKWLPRTKNPWHAQARLLEPFLWMYEYRELPARRLAQQHGRAALHDPQLAEALNRLRVGVSLPELRERVGGTGDGRSAAQAVSAFLDTSIDRGFVVPITSEADGIVFRAYRHGEDVKDSEQLRRLAVRTLAAFMTAASVAAVPRTWTEKLLVLLVKLLVDKKLVDPSDSMLGAYGTVGVRYDMHGPVLKREVPKLYSVHDQQAYTQLLTDCGYLKRDATGYSVANEPTDVPALPEGVVLAEKLGTSIGMLYHPGHSHDAEEPALDLGELVLLAACANARDISGALGAELQLFQYHWASLRSSISSRLDPATAKNVLRSLRSSLPFQAVNNGKNKFVGYNNHASTQIAARVETQLAGDPARQLLWRDLWATRAEPERDPSGAVERLVQAEGRALLLANLTFRLIELLCMHTLVNTAGLRRGPQRLRDEINEYLSLLDSIVATTDTVGTSVMQEARRLLNTRSVKSNERERVHNASLDILDRLVIEARGLLSEVDGIAARYGMTSMAEHFPHALILEVCGINDDETLTLAQESEQIIGHARMQAKKRRSPVRIEPISLIEEAPTDGRLRRWVFARGTNARQAMLKLAIELQRSITRHCGGRLALFLDLDRTEQPVIIGCGSILRNGLFWSRIDSILKGVTWRAGAIEVFTPRAATLTDISTEVSRESDKSMSSQVVSTDFRVGHD